MAEQLGDEARTPRASLPEGESRAGRGSAAARAANLLGGGVEPTPVPVASEGKEAFEKLFSGSPQSAETPAEATEEVPAETPAEAPAEAGQEPPQSFENLFTEEQGQPPTGEPPAEEISAEAPTAVEVVVPDVVADAAQSAPQEPEKQTSTAPDEHAP
jgi:hypothetical protein